jgi:RNA polymerase sigma-70 factor (ECF subfamily)
MKGSRVGSVVEASKGAGMGIPVATESPPMMSGEPATDDEALVAAAVGDRAAFAPLYRRYVDPVYRYCRRLGSREAAEDATSLIFAKALAALPVYRPRGQTFRSWLFAIAHNVVIDVVRARRPEAPVELALAIAAPDLGPEESALAAEARETAYGLLAGMTPEQRRMLELRLAGLTTAEIARALDLSPGAVRAIQFRAAVKLRARFGDAPWKREAPDA